MPVEYIIKAQRLCISSRHLQCGMSQSYPIGKSNSRNGIAIDGMPLLDMIFLYDLHPKEV
ncbi:MAG: hypothetical protein ACETVW_01660 [Dehalococcoidia bacterium]